jgi:hypothetical protein
VDGVARRAGDVRGVTIVVVPRERFSRALLSLASLLTHTRRDVAIVYVDAGSPPHVRRALEISARRNAFRLLRSDRFLTPNSARAIGLTAVRTPYTVFVDNDVVVTAGWLEALVRTALRKDATAVGPLVLEGDDPARRIVHQAGAFLRVEDGVLVEQHRHLGRPVAEACGLVTEPCDLLEYHCLLVRTDAVRRAIDPAILSTRDHVDLCLSVRAAGGTLWLEPTSRVVFTPPPPLAPSDLPYFLLRWSEGWTERTLRHFEAKWGARPQPLHFEFLRRQRRLALDGVEQRLSRLAGPRVGGWLMERVVAPAEERFNRRVVPRLWDDAPR